MNFNLILINQKLFKFKNRDDYELLKDLKGIREAFSALLNGK